MLVYFHKFSQCGRKGSVSIFKRARTSHALRVLEWSLENWDPLKGTRRLPRTGLSGSGRDKKGLDVDDDLDLLRKPLKISNKVYIGAYVQDVGNEEVENDYDSPITDNVATGSFVAPLNIMIVMAFELMHIRKKIINITKLLK